MRATISKIFFSFVILFSGLANAADLEIPVDIDRQKLGYDLYPVIQCPRPKKKYDDLLEKLGSIKDQIKKEACKKEEIDKIKDVESLETLVTSGRVEFIDLLKKGTSEDGELSKDEVDKLRNYVDQVVKKAAVITGLANNPACFDEDNKISVLNLLSSIVGEVSGALGAIPGPLGAKIGLGGKLAASLLSSIDAVVQARKTYDYDKYDHQKAYLNNLCAYYDFKADLDKETDTVTILSDLDDLIINADSLIDRLGNECADCQRIIGDFESRVEENVPYRFTENVNVSVNQEAGQLGVGGRTLTKSVEEMSWKDLKDYYLTSVETADEVAVVSAERSGPGTHTIRTLRTKTWAEEEIKLIENVDEEGLPEGGRREVMRSQEQIENFLVDHEGPRYIRHYSSVLNRDFSKLNDVAMKARRDLSIIRLQPDPNYEYSWRNGTIDNIHDLFRSDLDFANVVSSYMDTEQIQAVVESGKRQVKKAINLIRSDYSILKYQCQFYQYSGLKYAGPVGRSCSDAKYRLNTMEEFFGKLENTSFAVRNSRSLKVFSEKSKNYTRNWIESTSKVLEYMSEKENLVVEK